MTAKTEYATIREASEFLQVSYFTVYNHIRTGALPAEQKRGIYHIRWDDIHRYQKERDEAAQYDKRRAIRNTEPKQS